MAAPVIDYYFTSISPWVYLGHQALREIAQRHGAEIRVKPVNLAGVWEVSGAVPLAKRSPLRQRYRLIELQRYSEMRGIPLKLQPRHFPTDPTHADHTVAALVDLGIDPLPYMQKLFSAVWSEEENIANVATLSRLLEDAGHDSAAVIARAGDVRIADIRARNTVEATAADAVGVPAYVLNGEPFWGQDRLEMLDRALGSGRAPFRAQTWANLQRIGAGDRTGS